MTKILATSAIVSVMSLAIVGAAQAQVVVPPGQDFYATPMAHGDMMAMPEAKIVMPAAAKAPMKHKMMKHKMMKHTMMKHKMKKM